MVLKQIRLNIRRLKFDSILIFSLCTSAAPDFPLQIGQAFVVGTPDAAYLGLTFLISQNRTGFAYHPTELGIYNDLSRTLTVSLSPHAEVVVQDEIVFFSIEESTLNILKTSFGSNAYLSGFTGLATSNGQAVPFRETVNRVVFLMQREF